MTTPSGGPDSETLDVEAFLSSTVFPKGIPDRDTKYFAQAPWLVDPPEADSGTVDDVAVSSSIQDMRDEENFLEEIVYISSARPIWQPDSHALVCSACQVRFSFTRRRHHCRACGKIFCGSCCGTKAKLPHLGYFSRERICLGCAKSLAVH